MELRDVLTIVAMLLGSGGVLGGIYALLKLRPEAGQITVTTAQGVLLMQSDVMKELKDQNIRLQNRVDALEAENSELRRRVESVERGVRSVEKVVKQNDHDEPGPEG